jgi:hypothetical protein
MGVSFAPFVGLGMSRNGVLVSIFNGLGLGLESTGCVKESDAGMC